MKPHLFQACSQRERADPISPFLPRASSIALEDTTHGLEISSNTGQASETLQSRAYNTTNDVCINRSCDNPRLMTWVSRGVPIMKAKEGKQEAAFFMIEGKVRLLGRA